MRTFAFLFTTPFLFALHAQTGPGGVGNSTTNVLWLDADRGVTELNSLVESWEDRSGNYNTVNQANIRLQPEYLPDRMNGYPMIQFDDERAAPDYLRAPDDASLEGMTALTGFSVYQLAEGTPAFVPRGILNKRDLVREQEAYAWYLASGNASDKASLHTFLNIAGEGDGLIDRQNPLKSGPHISSFVFNGGPPADATDQRIYEGNRLMTAGAEPSKRIPDNKGDLYIGRVNGRADSRFNGDIGEVILYNYALGTAQRIIVNNYLAAKYGMRLNGSDLYGQDDIKNGNYDHDVAGIGRISQADLQTDSQGSGIVEVSGATDLGDNEFLFWGHDDGELSTLWGEDADHSRELQARLNRKWKVSEVTTAGTATDVGAVDLTFHLGDFEPVSAADLRLLVDANSNGVFADDEPISGASDLGNGRYVFHRVVAIHDSTGFTLGTTNALSPSSIELIAYSAIPVVEEICPGAGTGERAGK